MNEQYLCVLLVLPLKLHFPLHNSEHENGFYFLENLYNRIKVNSSKIVLRHNNKVRLTLENIKNNIEWIVLE